MEQENKPFQFEFNNHLELVTHILSNELQIIFKDLRIEAKRIDSNYYILEVSEEMLLKCKVKVIQILQSIKIIAYDVGKIKSFDFGISYSKFFKP